MGTHWVLQDKMPAVIFYTLYKHICKYTLKNEQIFLTCGEPQQWILHQKC